MKRSKLYMADIKLLQKIKKRDTPRTNLLSRHFAKSENKNTVR
jgi:hypothetical protein